MRNKNISRLFLVIFGMTFVFASSKLQANLDGTTGTSLYLGSNYTFTDHEVAKGYVELAGGFTLPNAGTAYVGVNQNVNGIINLNNGTLVLRDNIYLGAQAKIIGTGTIVGNFQTMFFESDHLFTSSINFRLPTGPNIIVINAQGNALQFAEADNPAVGFYCGQDADPFETLLLFKNATLSGVSGGKTGFPYNHGTKGIFHFINSRLLLFGQNGFTLEGDHSLFSGKADVLASNARFEIKAKSVGINGSTDLYISSGVRFVYNSPDPFGIRFALRSSRLILDSCSLMRDAGALGTSWTFTTGSMIINGFVTMDIEPGQQFLTLGDGVSARRDLDFTINPGSTFKINQGGIIYNNIF